MANLIQGSRAANQLSARDANDTVEGLAGNDTLSSMSETGIYLFGGDGNDTLIAKASDLLIDGGAGTDTVRFATGFTSLLDNVLEGVENVVLTNTVAGAYSFSLQSEALNITGTRLVDSITGGAGNDTITGGLGADQLVGGAGDDVLVAEATDALIDGTSGNDTVRFAAGVLKSAAGVYELTNGELVNIDNIVITNTGNAVYDFGDQSEALNITGGRGSDTITGGTAADTLSGGNGNDVLIAQASDALVDGGAGNDTVKYAAAVASLDDAELVNVEYVVITNTAGASYDFSSQTEGLDITGTGFADVIKGGSGADALRGGLDGDTLHAGDNDKLIDGGNGTDTAVFAASVSAKNLLDADLINVENISINNIGDAAYDFSMQSEKLSITGGDGSDTLTGGKASDTIFGGAGNDVIIASDLDVIGGDVSTVIGGTGNDTVRFAAAVSAVNLGNDDLTNIDNIVITNTRAGTYDFSVQTEIFNITGNSGNDTIKAATGTADTISGGAGNDVLVAEGTDALIDGGTGTDTVYFGAAVTTGLTDAKLVNVENVLLTGAITANFSVQTESLQISGSSGGDLITGGLRADTIIGGAGNDQLFGHDGADILIAESNDESINGGAGDDTVRFAAAVEAGTKTDAWLVGVENVVITNTGNAAYDFRYENEALNITGNSGADTLTGGLAADTLSGGAGNDVLVAAATDALIDGGAGTDTVRFAAAVTTANLVNADLVNVERVEITNTTSAAVYDFGVQTEALTIVGNTQVDSVTGGTGNDSISGEAGADVLTGGAGADTLVGGADNDVLTGGDGVDSLLGGDGDDTLNAQDIDARIDGGSGAGDTAQFAAGVTALNLTDAKLVGIENVTITNTAAASYDFSAQTEALVITGGAAADTIVGTQDWDTVTGAAGNDILTGAAGNDSLNGGAGNDILTGGVGLDTFNVGAGTDTITDLAAGETLLVTGGATAIVTGGLLDLTQLATATSNSGTVNVIGTAGADTINGTAGVDVITGGEGADTMSGRSGNDRFVIAAGDSVFSNGTAGQSDSAALDKVTDFAAGDLIVISGAITDTTFSVAGNVHVGTATGGAGDNQDNVNDFVATTYLVDLDGTTTTFELGLDVTSNGTTAAFANDAAAQAATVLNVTGTTGNDTIIGGVNDDTISGGLGADVINVGGGVNVVVIGNTDSGVTAATADTIVGFTDTNVSMGVAGDGTATTGNYVEVTNTDYVGNFTAILAALNTAAATLAATSAATELFVFAADTRVAAAGVGATGYLGNDIDGNGTIDQVIILTGIADNANIAAADIVA